MNMKAAWLAACAWQKDQDARIADTYKMAAIVLAYQAGKISKKQTLGEVIATAIRRQEEVG